MSGRWHLLMALQLWFTCSSPVKRMRCNSRRRYAKATPQPIGKVEGAVANVGDEAPFANRCHPTLYGIRKVFQRLQYPHPGLFSGHNGKPLVDRPMRMSDSVKVDADGFRQTASNHQTDKRQYEMILRLAAGVVGLYHQVPCNF